MSSKPTVEELQRLRAAARVNPAAGALLMPACRSSQATKEALMRTEGPQ